MVVSWHTLQSVRHPRVALGRLDGKLDRIAAAKEISYTDAKSAQTVYAYHATLTGLQPGAAYLYAALHDGAEPEFGTFRTVPSGRVPFMFTSFGDQGTPSLGKRYAPRPASRCRTCRTSTIISAPQRKRYHARRGAAAPGVSSLQR
jgi:ribosomal protein L37E